ncbi:MAG: hypothetical protein AAFX10_04665, partial [Pseudomonadota bacterium]
MRSLIVAALFAAFPAVHGGELDISSNVELQSRVFANEPAQPAQDGQVLQGTLAWQSEFRWRNEDRDQRASFIPYLRWDAVDSERSL